MTKRQKWTAKEDTDLSKLVYENEEDPRWDVIAYNMEELGHRKSAKQCRERFYNKMDASDKPKAKQANMDRHGQCSSFPFTKEPKKPLEKDC